MGGSSALEVRRAIESCFSPEPVPETVRAALDHLENGNVIRAISALLSVPERAFDVPEAPPAPAQALGMAGLLEVAQCLYLDDEALTPAVARLLTAACCRPDRAGGTREAPEASATAPVPPDSKGLATAVRLLATSADIAAGVAGRFDLALHLTKLLLVDLDDPVTTVFTFRQADAPSPSRINMPWGATPGALVLPTVNWGHFRSYQFVAWVKMDRGAGAFSLFQFSGSGGLSVEARLGEEDPNNIGLRPFTMVTKPRETAMRIQPTHSFQGALRLNPDQWNLVAVSHSQPYLKKPKVTVYVDTKAQIYKQELHYPAALGGNNPADLLGSATAFTSFQGQVSGLAFYGSSDALNEEAITLLYAAGPNHIVFHQPLRVPVSTQETHTHPLATGLGHATCTSEPQQPMWAFLPACSGPNDPRRSPFAAGQTRLCCPLVTRGAARSDYLRMEALQTDDSLSEGCLRLEGTVRMEWPGIGLELWFRLGGVRCLLYVMARVVAGSAATGPTPLKHSSDTTKLGELVAALMVMLSKLLKADIAFLEEMLQIHGFHVLMSILLRIPEPAVALTRAVAQGMLEVLMAAMGTEARLQSGNSQLKAAALQGLGNLRLWAQAPPAVQAEFFEGYAVLACPHARELRASIGVVGLLDKAHRHLTLRHSRFQQRQQKSEAPTEEYNAGVSRTMDALQRLLLVMVDYGLSQNGGAVPTVPKQPKNKNAAVPAPLSEVGWMVRYLQENTSDTLLASSILWVLLQLRASYGPRFKVELWQSDFVQTTSYEVLSAPGYSIDLRQDCLRLALWQLWQHSTRNQEDYMPQTRRQSPKNDGNKVFVGLRNNMHILLARSAGRGVVQGHWGPKIGQEVIGLLTSDHQLGEFGDQGLPMWLGVPFLSAFLQLAPLAARRETTLSFIVKLKGDPTMQDEMIKYTPVWITCFLQMGLCWPEEGRDDWQDIEVLEDGEDPVSVDADEVRKTCLDACLDTIACVMDNQMGVDPTGWKLWQKLLAALDYLQTTNDCFPVDVGMLHGHVFPKLFSMVLGRLTKNVTEWNEARVESLSKIVLFTEERFFNKSGDSSLSSSCANEVEQKNGEDESKKSEEGLLRWEWDLVDYLIQVSESLRAHVERDLILPETNPRRAPSIERHRTATGSFHGSFQGSFHGSQRSRSFLRRREASLSSEFSDDSSTEGGFGTSPYPQPYNLGLTATSTHQEVKMMIAHRKQVTGAVLKISQPITRVLMNILGRSNLEQTMNATDELCKLLVLTISAPNLDIQSHIAVNMVMQVLSFFKDLADNGKRPKNIEGLLCARALQLTHDLNPQLILENAEEMVTTVNNQNLASLAVSEVMKPMAQARDAKEVFASLAEVLEKLEITEALDPDAVCVDLFEADVGGNLAALSLKSEADYQEEVRQKVEQTMLQERSRGEVSGLAEDASLGRVERHWRKLIRLTEAELGLQGIFALGPSTGLDRGRSKSGRAAAGASILGRPQYKLAGSAHEGPILARRRPIIKLQAGFAAELEANSQSLLSIQKRPSMVEEIAENIELKKCQSADEVTQSNIQLAKKCSQYITDLPSEQSSPRPSPEENKEEPNSSGALLRDWGVVTEDTAQGTPDLTNEVDLDDDDEEERAGAETDRKYKFDLSDDGKLCVQDLGPGLGPSLDPEKTVLTVEQNVILVMPKGNQGGILYLTKKHIYFRPQNPEEEDMTSVDDGVIDLVGNGALQRQKNRRWLIHWINGIYLRRYRLRNTAFEVFFRNGKSRSFFLDFGSNGGANLRRDNFLKILLHLAPRSAFKEYPDSSPKILLQQHSATLRWQRREISNFDYLMALNTFAGRSFNDLCQYPVFPWILSNYVEEKIDLTEEENYRDLRKPMGAINPARLKEFVERFNSLEANPSSVRPFMYGSHYSTAMGVVLHFLVRLQPYAALHCAMQSGSFDVADRLFGSVPQAWEMCTTTHSEVKELTPEWFSLPDFLRNVNNFQFGETQDGRTVSDVILPPWAKTPEDFIRIQREALESDYVSNNLHHWIDLIFGYKQQGQAAINAYNVFFHLTYYGSVDTSSMNEADRMATELQIAHFGQCPNQIFSSPHPPRGGRFCCPRPIGHAIKAWDGWLSMVEGQILGYIPPISPAAICAVKVLPGKVVAVDANGVVSSYKWWWNIDQTTADTGPVDPTLMETAPTELHSPTVQDHIGFNLEQDLSPFTTLPRVPLGPSAVVGSHMGRTYGQEMPVCFSQRGDFVVSGGPALGGGAFTVSQLDPQTHQVAATLTLQAHVLRVSCVAVSVVHSSQTGVVLAGSVDGTASLWHLRNLGSVFRSPRAVRRPLKIIRGHYSPIICCSLSTSMGLCMTCSKGLALVHSLEGENLLQRIEITDQTGFVSYAHCGLSSLGFIIVCSQPSYEDGIQPPLAQSVNISRIEVYTVNGERVASKELDVTILSMRISFDGEYLTIVGSNALSETYLIPTLKLAKRFDFASMMARNQAGFPTSSHNTDAFSDADFTALDLGPFSHAPCVMAVGTSNGGMLVQAFPDTERWCMNQGSAINQLVETPKWLVQGAAKNATVIANSAMGKAEGITSTARGIAGEALGEAKTFFKSVFRQKRR